MVRREPPRRGVRTVNTAYRGGVLEDVVKNSGAEVAVVHPQLATRLREVYTGELRRVVIVGASEGIQVDLELYSSTIFDLDDGFARPRRAVEAWDDMTIIYTSGTSGPTKGVLSSYAHHYTPAVAAFADRIAPGERYLFNLPLFRVAGTLGVYAMLLLGGSAVVASGFDTETFWESVRTTGVTSCTLLGVMATFPMKQPPRPGDDDNPLRWAWEGAPEFGKRFGLVNYTMFHMTEISCPVISGPNPAQVGSCGRRRAGVEARIVDEHDRVVPAGEVGELVLRSSRPWSMNHGYNAMPEATAAAWRNGWFHTGDAMRVTGSGEYVFVDRRLDTIRRRGENISSFEIEAEVLAYPDVLEAVAVGVPSDLGEDDVLVVVAPVAGRDIDPGELVDFLLPRMAHFMVPRYVRLVNELPKTATNKVQKHTLRSVSVTPETWDREEARQTIRREHLA